MRRVFMALAVAVQLGCGASTAPSPLASSYFLSTVDGKALPVPHGGEGWTLVAGLLDFGRPDRPRGTSAVSGTVRYILDLRRPDQSLEHSDLVLNYTIQDGILRIDLCPPGALCFVATELVGPVADGSGELVLTNYVAGAPGSIYRFVAVLSL